MLQFVHPPIEEGIRNQISKGRLQQLFEHCLKNATLAGGGGGCRYIPRFVSPLSIFSEGAIWKLFRNFQTLKFNSGAIKWLFQNRFDIDKTVLHVLLSSKLNGGWYIENRECHKSFDFPTSFPPLTRFWTWTIIDQTIANPIIVPKTQVKPGQSFFFSLVCHKLLTKGISDIKAPCKQGIRRTYNSFWQKGNVFEPLFPFSHKV